ncbi:sigma-54 interaction domain-containing protein [Desulfitobacterium sp.]|uniref:sigma-54 interaction domain-containing protein n=1 Tax=Desulfitobacterium sp. TaxID=49981 RepID=UPI002C1063B7|nr:sigma 54-interacting transcriptional regulator [Desulfitobacterium sp.]HVJ49662.1 sigma 54-interacting transcriptional regulator [Desulfitobacterium sp.]
MYFNYNESNMKKNREVFFATGCFVEEEVRSEIAQSWKRCHAEGLKHELSSMENSLRSIVVTKDMSYLRDSVLQSIVASLYETCDRSRAALFYAYDDGIVFSQRGNEDMLRYFNALNIGIGTCITEETLGTTGVALIKEANQEAWVVGEEHYLDILLPFVTHCFYSEDFNGRTYTLIILPKDEFTDLFHLYLQLFHKARKATLEDYRINLELAMKTNLFIQFLENKNQGILFIDIFGKIITANSTFLNWFKMKLDEVKNIDCLKLFPELEKALTCLHTGNKIIFEEVFFHNNHAHSQFMRMDVTPMFQGLEISGLIITLCDTRGVRRTVNKISNSQAYYTFDNIIGNSSELKGVKEKSRTAGQSNSSVIITGESGTGKELFAQSIHNASIRKEGPFVALNCAAIQQELIASELFGYVEGAFTGARKGGSMGKFEYADQGTLFLDEIGELPLFAQTILLRVLEERTVTRIGSNVTTPIDVRLICATNRDLKKMVKEGTFRLDLYYRINVIHLRLPALRERITDIPLLVNYYLDHFDEQLDKKVERVSPEAMSYLVRYPWPGNSRELRNTIECGVNNAIGRFLELKDLPYDIVDYFECEDREEFGQISSQGKEFDKEERKKILSLMIEYNGNKSQVAEKLGISRSTLYKKLRDYQLK